jgi:glycosyltransferase involved in cell wall biosynthesis
VRVSIVTPSLQQGQFIERTLDSVWRQSRGGLAGQIEHIVMDGGSTDGTAAILERWRDRISYSSGPDGGQSAAINAGLAMAGGEILAYLNSDDIYYEGAIAAAVAAFDADPSVDVVYGEGDLIDCDDRFIDRYPTEGWSLERLKLLCFLCQPAVFFRRRVLEQFGPFDATLNYCMDYEYWLRIAARGARFAHIPVTLAASRIHPATKTLSAPLRVHIETNDMLQERLGTVPANWLSNYAYAVLDDRGIGRNASRKYLARVAALTVGAAFRWNRVPSISLLRTLTSSLLRGSSTVPPRLAIHA